MGDQLHEHLGKKLDEASYLLGFARSIIESFTGGLPASDATIAEFKRDYDAHFGARRGGKCIVGDFAQIGETGVDSHRGQCRGADHE